MMKIEDFSGDIYYDASGFDSITDYDLALFFNEDAAVEENDVNDTSVGPSKMIPCTPQDSQNDNNVMLKPENNTNDISVEPCIAIPPVPQDDLPIENKGIIYSSDTVQNDTDDNICPDTTRISANTTQAGVDNYRTSKICITLEVLQQHYGMSMVVAAQRLDVSVSTLKRICRHNGITRWPNCRKRKRIKQSSNTKNVNKLVQNNKDETNQSTRRQGKIISSLGDASSSNVTIKATYGDDIVKFPFSVSSRLVDLKEKVCMWLDLVIPIRLKYKDDAGDLVFIGCDDALHQLFHTRLSTSVDHNTTFGFLVFPVSS